LTEFSLTPSAYIRGHPLYTPLAGKLARDTSLRVFGVQYRKCLDDASAFPAPLLDTLAAWRCLTTTLGFAPSNILVTGESAGGHLTLALVQQLSALDLPLPGAIAICSPWVDMTMSLPSWQRNKNDILCKPALELAVRSATRHYDESTKAGWFSPAFAPKGHWSFLAAVPAFVSVGTAEAFEDEIEKLAEGMRGDGVDVTLWRVSGASCGGLKSHVSEGEEMGRVSLRYALRQCSPSHDLICVPR